MKITTKEAMEKAEKLVLQMSLEEKVLQLGVSAPAIKRLDIPSYHYWNEGLHGVARAGVATLFPQAIGMAAMFDKEKIKEIGDIIATEARAKYNMALEYDDHDIYKGLTFWSPNINIFRDPRWGRGHETYGEDPYLTGELAKEFIRGLQGDEDYMKAAACVKHFAVHSGPEKGRGSFNAEVSQKDLNETYLPAFETCVKDADVEIVMSAYNAVNGVPVSVHKELLGMLRTDWGFTGHITSDCLALENLTLEHKYSKDHATGLAEAIESGVDLNCGLATKALLTALEQKLIEEETITKACVHLYTTRYKLGMFSKDNQFDHIPYQVVECREHQKAAYEAAVNSFVLLKNEKILPIKKTSLKSVAVIGPNANSRKALVGNYEGTASRYITILEGIQDALGEDTRVYYSEGCALMQDKVEALAKEHDRISEALKISTLSDVIFLCLGLDATIEGEDGDGGNAYAAGDKADLNLPKGQQLLLEKVLEVGKPVILILAAGSALTFDGMENHPNLKAIMDVWYPGAQGGKALADILFGSISPSGKLPITFYHSLGDLPDFEDYSMTGRTYRYVNQEVLYPFGYGMTYSKMELSNAHYKDHVVYLDVENIGSFDTGDVVQVYVKHMTSKDEVKNYRLCGFERVFISQKERKTISVPLDSNTFTLVNEQGVRYEATGDYELYISTCQPDARSTELTGTVPLIFHSSRSFE